MAKSVLVIDDTHDCADPLARLLRTNGHHVEVAYNGREALDRLDHFQADVILLDLMMPVMDGLSFLEFCRKRADCRDVRVIVFTGYAQGINAKRLMELGVGQILLKGAVQFDELVDLVEISA